MAGSNQNALTPVALSRATAEVMGAVSRGTVFDSLKLILAGAPLNEILKTVARVIEAQSPGLLCSILLVDESGLHMRYAAKPDLSQAYLSATDELAIGPSEGSCGTAAFLRQPVFAADILCDEKWAKYRDVAAAAGVRAAWSNPILSPDGSVWGTFGMFYREVRYPSSSEIELIQHASSIAGIALERDRAHVELLTAFEQIKKSERQLQQTVDAIPQTIVVLSPNGGIDYANRTVLDYTGLTMDELMLGDFRPRVFHPEDLERLAETRRLGFERGLPWENELRVRGKDGRYRWFLIRYSPLVDEHGHVLRWCAAGTDIDARKRNEEKLLEENLALREEIDRASTYEEIVGSSEPLRRVFSQIDKVAPTDSTVLILGETGTGKELIAAAIHRRSRRSDRPFVRVNCAAIPPSLIASELFGHEKGAFTGAIQRRMGRFETADGGTIFLDEIGDLPAETQIALLRVLQEREFERTGSNSPIYVDVRVIAATNRDLEASVTSGTFRDDLFYRLNVFPIRVPPLRERQDDIPLLVEYLVEYYGKRIGKKINHVSKTAFELFQSYDWPGNVRELQNVVERAVILSDGGALSIDESWLRRKSDKPYTAAVRVGILAEDEKRLAEQEKGVIEAALQACRGRVSGPSGAAAKLGIPHQTLESKIARLGIDKHRFRNVPQKA
jgi:formate hydrogenlyase transcriptional activator